MHFFYLIVSLFPLLSLAEVNGRCSGSSGGGTATGQYLTDGICEPIDTCNYYHGSYINGGCPNDVSDVKCCLVGLEGSASYNPCGGISWCDWTDNTDCPGTFEKNTGHCPGLSNYQCCYTP